MDGRKFLSLLEKRPAAVALEVTTKCPLNCAYCGRHMLEHKNKNLSLEVLGRMKERLKHAKQVLLCGMGEPFAHGGFYDLVAELAGRRVVMVTCGTILIDFARLNKANNVAVVIFSVDAPDGEGMKAIAGNYNWPNLLKNLEARASFPSITAGINCTINANNVRRLPEMVAFAKAHKVQWISFDHPVRVGDGADFAEENREEIEHYLGLARRAASESGVYMDSPYRAKCVLSDSVVPYISLTGDVYPCFMAMSKLHSVGNILEQEFEDLWRTAEYRKFQGGEMCEGGCPIYRRQCTGHVAPS